jgi:Ca2+-binding EF-hand superfamily protein
VLDELSALPDHEKLSTLFEMLDKDGDGKLTAVELAAGLRKIRGDLDFEQSLALAIDRVSSFDTDQDGMLDQSEFETLLNTILPLIGCSFHELSEMLIVQVLFSSTGNSPEESSVAEVIAKEITEQVMLDEALTLRYAMKDRRMKALFNVFDEDGTGSVDFKDVVVGMYKLMDGIDEASHAAVTALLLLDEKNQELFRTKISRGSC